MRRKAQKTDFSDIENKPNFWAAAANTTSLLSQVVFSVSDNGYNIIQFKSKRELLIYGRDLVKVSNALPT